MYMCVEIPGLTSYFPLKNLAFETPHPHPLGISRDHPWVGMDIFLDHIKVIFALVAREFKP